MYTIYLITGLSFIVFLVYHFIKKPFDWDYEREYYFIYGLLVLALSGTLSFVVAAILPAKTFYKKSVYQVESIQDSNSISGKFYLGCGQINSKMVFSMYLKDDISFKLFQVESEKTTIKYVNTNPYLEIFISTKTNHFFNDFCLPNYDYYYVVNVPKGSILNNFSLDAK